MILYGYMKTKLHNFEEMVKYHSDILIVYRRCLYLSLLKNFRLVDVLGEKA